MNTAQNAADARYYKGKVRSNEMMAHPNYDEPWQAPQPSPTS
jgi:hypothetical protein